MADENWDHLDRYVGTDNMTTNEAIHWRAIPSQVGLQAEDFGVDGRLQPSGDRMILNGLGHIPYCRAEWKAGHARSTGV